MEVTWEIRIHVEDRSLPRILTALLRNRVGDVPDIKAAKLATRDFVSALREVNDPLKDHRLLPAFSPMIKAFAGDHANCSSGTSMASPNSINLFARGHKLYVCVVLHVNARTVSIHTLPETLPSAIAELASLLPGAGR